MDTKLAEKLKRLKEIHEELFNMANSLAGDVTGTVAVEVHKAHGVLNNAIRMLETGVTAEDTKKMYRDWFKQQPINAKKSDLEIEELVVAVTQMMGRKA